MRLIEILSASHDKYPYLIIEAIIISAIITFTISLMSFIYAFLMKYKQMENKKLYENQIEKFKKLSICAFILGFLETILLIIVFIFQIGI